MTVTVKDLIEHLKKFNQDAEVFIYDSEWEDFVNLYLDEVYANREGTEVKLSF